MNEQMNISGRTYDIVDHIALTDKITVPLVNIPMLSDERWNELARQQKGGIIHERFADF